MQFFIDDRQTLLRLQRVNAYNRPMVTSIYIFLTSIRMLLNSSFSCENPVGPTRNPFLVIFIMSSSYFIGGWKVDFCFMIEGQKLFLDDSLVLKLIILEHFEILHMLLCIFDIGYSLKILFFIHLNTVVKIPTQNHLFSIISLNHLLGYFQQDLISSLVACLVWSQMTVYHLKILSLKIKHNAYCPFIPQNIAPPCSKL